MITCLGYLRFEAETGQICQNEEFTILTVEVVYEPGNCTYTFLIILSYLVF